MAGEGQATGNTGATGTPPADQGQQGAGEGSRTFTQEQLDAIVQERLKKATQGRVSLEEFGLKSKEELTKLLEAQKAAEEQAKSEQEKAIEEARSSGRKEAENEIMGRANARLIRSEFIAAAKDRNVVDPGALYLIAKGEDKLSALTVSDADEVEGFDDAFWEDLLKDRPYLVTAPGGGQTPPPGQQGQRQTPGDANAGSQGGTKVPDDRRAELAKRYPALAKRR